MMMKVYGLIFCLICSFTITSGQNVFKLKAFPSQQCTEEERSIVSSLKYKTEFSDSAQRLREVQSIMNRLYSSGYLAAEALLAERDSIKWTISIRPGLGYQWAKLNRGNVDEAILSMTGIREKFYSGRDFKPAEIVSVMNKLLQWCDRNGYPFATASLSDLKIESNRIFASLLLDKGKPFSIDSILVKGNAKLHAAYLQSYLGIKQRSVYNEQIISRITSRIKELPMVSETKPYAVAFHDSTATLFLYLQNQKASKLDGIVGVLPDNNQPGKVNVTGDVSIRLLSAFGYGELIDFNWKLPESKTQDLKTRFNYPFLFQTPFGIDLGLNIYKKDTTYIELNRMIGVQFSMTGGNFIKAYFENRKSTLLNTKQYESVTVLPPFADISSRHYGLAFKSSRLDYRLNPRQGYVAELSASAGTKTITPNSKLKQIDYSKLQLKSTQYLLKLSSDFYLPIGNRMVNNAGLISGALIGKETFQNELYRIGGLKSLRGFDEESILTSQFVILKNEWRFILEENSYLQAFINAAWYERKQRDYFITDKPIGFGAGITFETKLGIFSLNYALGKEFDNPIRFRAAKVHFGLVNYF
ncbi:MAG: BamA/TamA family outer membrane protein [Bacteroidia bacterium]|nr:BamA/TamA family outer membrane protein [Bacteroidia bacterium]